jgi:hypothetical protein
MQKGTWNRIILRFDLVLFLILLPSGSALAQVVITTLKPPAVNQGGTYKFTANVPVTWSMAPGRKGSIDSDGTYHAPAEVTAQQSIGGCQLLPNDHILNTRIDSLPVNSNSAAWINSANYGHLIYGHQIPINYSDGSTPTQKMAFWYAKDNNDNFTFPVYPLGDMEGGWPVPSVTDAVMNQFNTRDHHLISVNPTTCHITEIMSYYQAGANPANRAVSSTAGIQYDNSDYDLNTKGTTDAAGLPILPMMTHFQEWQSAVNTGGTINHAERITFRPGAIKNLVYLWPATEPDYSGFGAVPFGARVRLKSSFNISAFSAPAQVLLRQLQQYGAILDDTGSDWEVNVDAGKLPNAYDHAFTEISAAKIAPSNFEFVDESGLEVTAKSGKTTTAEKVCATSGNSSTCQQVVLMGVTIGVPKNALYIQASTGEQQLVAWVNGSSNTRVTWTMNPTVGTLTSGGIYTPPPTVGINTATLVTASSNANPNVTATFTLVVLTAGTIRLQMGGPCADGLTITNPVSPFNCVSTGYVDSKGNTWQAETGDDGGEELNCGGGIPPWPNLPDIGLYEIPYTSNGDNDLRFEMTVPNGTYSITAKFAYHCPYNNTVGSTALNLETQGRIVFPNVDVVASAGGGTLPVDFVLPATVTNNHLSFVLRYMKGSAGATISALEIAPSVGAVTPVVRPSGLAVIEVK